MAASLADAAHEEKAATEGFGVADAGEQRRGLGALQSYARERQQPQAQCLGVADA